MSCSRELVKCVCFCVMHSVSIYRCTTSPNGSGGVGVEVDCMLRVRESVCSSHSRQSICSNPSTVWPSPASMHCHKLHIFLVSMFKSAWLLGRRSLRQPSTADPPRAIIVSELFVLSLPSMFPVQVSVFACISCSSMASGHSMTCICLQFSWAQFRMVNMPSSFVVVACHVQSISHNVVW